MPHNEINPWWRCIRLIWRPDTLAETAINVPLWMAGLFGGTAAGLLMGGFFTWLGTAFYEPWGGWLDIYQAFQNSYMTCGIIPFAVIFCVAFLPSLVVFRDNWWPGIQVILLSPITIFIPGVFWLVVSSLYDLQQSYVMPDYPRVEFLDSLVIAFLGSCFWLPVGLFLWLTALAWGFHRLKELTISGNPHCESCHYDLRGSIPAGSTLCPECGELIDEAMIRKHRDTPPA